MYFIESFEKSESLFYSTRVKLAMVFYDIKMSFLKVTITQAENVIFNNMIFFCLVCFFRRGVGVKFSVFVIFFFVSFLFSYLL